jgi:sugar phosphate isomerase/epimerase
MKNIKGPGIFLAQFLSDEAPFNSLTNMCNWLAQLGYKAVQIPTWDKRVFDLELVANSQTYCDEIATVVKAAGLQISELSTHLQGKLVAVHPAYDQTFDGFTPEAVINNPKQRRYGQRNNLSSRHWPVKGLA